MQGRVKQYLRILVNSALPYANSSLHLGHIAGAYLPADIFVRYKRMVGDEVMFVSGSDQHGTPITIAADKLKVEPSVVADKYYKEHLEDFKSLDISFDVFMKTSSEEHKETVREIFIELYKNGFLSEKMMVSPFCPGCNRFMPDRYIEGTCPYCGYEKALGDQCENCGRTLDPIELINPKCTVCEGVPEFRESKQMFFDLPKFQDKLLDWLKSKEYWRSNVLSFTRNFIESGLKERAITRDIEWGVPVPLAGYENKRIYVWFEALIGYLTGAKIYSKSIGEPDYWKKFYLDSDARDYYFIGKDNIPFHTIIWPAMLFGIGRYNLPYDVPANEYLTAKGEKFSKSRSIGFQVKEILKLVDKDYVRYYLSTILPESGDTDFSIEELQSRVNTELIDKFGNYIHRLVSFVVNNSLEINADTVNPDQNDLNALATLREALDKYRTHMDAIQIKKALNEWLELVKFANAYMNDSKPWALLKTDKEKCESKLYYALLMGEALCMMAYPFIPSSSDKLLKIIGSESYRSKGVTVDFIGNVGNKFSPVRSGPPFVKLSIEVSNPNLLDLKIGKITEVKEHPNAQKLYILKVDLGYRIAQLVAGLRAHYSVHELVGKNIVVVDNLKHARLRGEESQGMLLAADDGNTVSLLVPDGIVNIGSSLEIGNFKYNGHGKIEVEDVTATKLHVKRSGEKNYAFASFGDEDLKLSVNGVSITTDKNVDDGAKVR